MRFDPEDYAFVARYDVRRLSGEVLGLRKAALMRTLFAVIAVAIVLIIAGTSGKLHPTTWFSTTIIASCLVMIVTILTALVSVLERFVSISSSWFHVAMTILLLLCSGSLLFPVWLLTSNIGGYGTVVRNFANDLGANVSSDARAEVQPLVTGLNVVHIVLIIFLVLCAIALVAAVIALFTWLAKPRNMGWRHRRILRTALAMPPGLLMLAGAGVVLLSVWLVPRIENQLTNGAVEVPQDTTLPSTMLFSDWLIWLLAAGLLITVITFMNGVVSAIFGGIILERMPAGNALRVDPLGVVLDDVKTGPQRVIWPAIDLIGSAARGALPGPELVIGRSGSSEWTVPFMFLDVLPGTIDSAVRAHTQDARDLDLTQLDKAF